MEVELVFVGQFLVDLRGIGLRHIAVGTVGDVVDLILQALHEVVGALVGAILTRGLDLDAVGAAIFQHGRQTIGQTGRQLGVLLLADDGQQTVTELLVGGGHQIHLVTQGLAECGQGTLTGRLFPHQLGQHVIFRAGE